MGTTVFFFSTDLPIFPTEKNVHHRIKNDALIMVYVGSYVSVYAMHYLDYRPTLRASKLVLISWKVPALLYSKSAPEGSRMQEN